MFAGEIKTATIDIDRASEFTGDDVDRFSDLVDLGDNFSKVLVWIPALDASGVVSVYVQRDGSEASIPLQMQSFDCDGTGHFVQGTSSGGGSIVIVFNIGGVQHLRIHVAADQAADRTFYVKGC
jgi:hypothetical protein